MILVKLADGSVVRLTDKEHKQLTDSGIVEINKSKYSKEYYKDRIIEALKLSGDISEGRLFNKWRKNKQMFDLAIDELAINNVIRISIANHKYNGVSVRIISLNT